MVFPGLRVLAGLTGLVTGGLVLIGRMTIHEFIVADLIIGGLLILGALWPARRPAWLMMTVGNAYALGVFTVALARQLGPVPPVNPPLVVVMITAGLGLIGLSLSPPRD
jgi:hypothetical protein